MTLPALAKLGRLDPAARARAVAQLSAEEARELDRLAEGLNEFIPRVSRQYKAPLHLAPLVRELERARHEEVQLVVHAPPRHTKTETILHAFAWHLALEPWRTHAFATYAADLSQSKSRKARLLAQAAGVKLSSELLSEWRTREGGGLLATGVGGPFTGKGVDGLLVVDDPIKNRVEAESGTSREKVWDWFNDVAYTRREPGASVIVVMTRWHPDDLAGRLVREKGWKYLKLPAMTERGALWPEHFSAERLQGIRTQVGEYTWSSLYQGEPRARGGAVFGDPRTYTQVPTEGMRFAIGVDLAYSKKTQADWSVAVLLGEKQGIVYVLDVRREQMQAPAFGARLKALQEARGRPTTRWYASGPEQGVGDLLKTMGVRLDVLPAHGDKFVRAQPVAAAWNAGNVLVPANAPWSEKFLDELASFTGVDDEHDDQVDALAAGFDALAHPTPSFDSLPKRTLTARRI